MPRAAPNHGQMSRILCNVKHHRNEMKDPMQYHMDFLKYSVTTHAMFMSSTLSSHREVPLGSLIESLWFREAPRPGVSEHDEIGQHAK
jgi:hypothetical protein